MVLTDSSTQPTSSPGPAGRWLRRRRTARRPSLVLCGAGVGPGLHLSVEAQQLIMGVGEVATLAAPSTAIEHLRASRVRVSVLDDLVHEADTYADGYLAVIDVMLERASTSPPAVLLCGGNPLFLNSTARGLVDLARQRDIDLRLVPAVSVIDTVVNDIGLDVGGAGLQVFDARQLLGSSIDPNALVPLLVLGVDALADDRVLPAEVTTKQVWSIFGRRLARGYAPSDIVTLVTQTTGSGSLDHVTVTLADWDALVDQLVPGAHLYVRPTRAGHHDRTDPRLENP